MAKKRLIELKKGKCISALLLALLSLKKASSTAWSIRTKLQLVSKCLLNFEKLAVFAGISTLQLVSGIQLNAKDLQLSSTIFTDIDTDGDVDVVEIPAISNSLFLHRNVGAFYSLEKIPVSSFVPSFVGKISNTQTGKNDLVLIDKQNGKFSTLQNNGTDGFIVAESGSLNTPLNEVILNDFDQDGDQDMVYSSTGGAIGWAKNQGSDGFLPQGNLIGGLSSDVSSIDTIDYQNDGDTDIKFSSGGLAQFHANNGSDGFSPVAGYTSGNDYSFHQQDINDDGTPDSTRVSANGQISVAKSQGTEGFVTQSSNLQSNIQSSILHDLDDDSDLDLVYTTPSGIAWAKNEGSDGFIQQGVFHQTSANVGNFEIKDADFDGDEDIFFSESNKLGFGFLKNDGSENFQLQEFGRELANPQTLKSALGLDIDGDNDLDLVDVPGDSEKLIIQENSNQDWTQKSSIALPFVPSSIAPLNLNGDTEDDLFVLDQTTGKYSLLSNNGSDGFVLNSSGNLNATIQQAILADMDADGDQDLVFSDNTNLVWAKNDGSNGFVPQTTILSGIGSLDAIEISDIDDDGDHDILFSTPGNGLVTILNNQGSEGFESEQINSGATSINDLEFADIDNDGDDDLVYASSTDSTIGMFTNKGSDGFTPSGAIATGITQVDQIKVTDLDLDEDLDIVAASSQNNDSFWIQNTETDGFSPQQLG